MATPSVSVTWTLTAADLLISREIETETGAGAQATGGETGAGAGARATGGDVATRA